MRSAVPANRVRSLLAAEPQNWLPASVEGEVSYLAPDGWSLTWRGLVVYDTREGRNVLLPAWRFHGKAQDARRRG